MHYQKVRNLRFNSQVCSANSTSNKLYERKSIICRNTFYTLNTEKSDEVMHAAYYLEIA